MLWQEVILKNIGLYVLTAIVILPHYLTENMDKAAPNAPKKKGKIKKELEQPAQALFLFSLIIVLFDIPVISSTSL